MTQQQQFIFGCAGSSLFFSSCGQRGILLFWVLQLLGAVVSLVAEHRVCIVGVSVVVAPRTLEHRLDIVAHGLSCSVTCGSSQTDS